MMLGSDGHPTRRLRASLTVYCVGQKLHDTLSKIYGIPCAAKTLAKLACVSSEGPPFRFAGRFRFIPLLALTLGSEQDWTVGCRSTSEVRRPILPSGKVTMR